MEKKYDKRIFYTIFAAITITGFIIICTLGQTVHQKRVEAKLVETTTSVSAPLYTVKSEGSEIIIYRKGSDRPYMVLDFDVSLLSEVDRKQLEEGIEFNDTSDLRIYIDDISS